MKTILLPTDFSANAQNAINYAVSMFGDKKINFILLNAYRISPINIEEYVTDIPDFEQESKKGLKKILNKINKNFPGKKFSIETISKLGYPVQVIDKTVKRKKVDLIIMGTKGASGIKEVLIGSITSDTIKNIDCPVLAIPEKAKFNVPRNIAFAADFKNLKKKLSLKPLIDIAKNYAAEILVLHIQHKGKTTNNKERLRELNMYELFGKIRHSLHIVEDKDAVNGIENFIKTREVNMLAMVSRKHSFIEKLFNKSVTKKLALHSKIPLLALQQNTK